MNGYLLFLHGQSDDIPIQMFLSQAEAEAAGDKIAAEIRRLWPDVGMPAPEERAAVLAKHPNLMTEWDQFHSYYENLTEPAFGLRTAGTPHSTGWVLFAAGLPIANHQWNFFDEDEDPKPGAMPRDD